MNKNKLLIWLKDFKYKWLPQNILNDTHLIELISNKLHEFEQLIILENNQNDNEISIETEHQCNTEQRTSPDIHSQIDDEKETFHRPTILLKRILLAEAEQYLPSAWKTKSKTDQKNVEKDHQIIPIEREIEKMLNH